jgi:hypothetical protein
LILAKRIGFRMELSALTAISPVDGRYGARS